MGFLFPRHGLGFRWTGFVGKERKTGSIMATTVSHKGSRGMCAADKCLHYADENGDAEGDILIKGGTEESKKWLVRCIQEERSEGRTVVEEAPKKVKGSNGVVERAVQEIDGRVTRDI
eukprot:6215095-Karenia_brevis.AAC.1